jgi:hypothetical protein
MLSKRLILTLSLKTAADPVSCPCRCFRSLSLFPQAISVDLTDFRMSPTLER